MRIFVTGVGGYLGGMLAERLAQMPEVEGVTGIDVSRPGSPPDGVEFYNLGPDDSTLWEDFLDAIGVGGKPPIPEVPAWLVRAVMAFGWRLSGRADASVVAYGDARVSGGEQREDEGRRLGASLQQYRGSGDGAMRKSEGSAGVL